MQALEDRPAPPPPAVSSTEGRVGLNTRIPKSWDDALRAYQAQHGSNRQKVVDQMVREYLERRGIFPGDQTS